MGACIFIQAQLIYYGGISIAEHSSLAQWDFNGGIIFWIVNYKCQHLTGGERG
jgi:hypothetical protein